MLYTEKEKTEIERVRKVFAEHLQQSTNFELLWSDKVGFVWLAIGLNPLYVDTGRRISQPITKTGYSNPLLHCLSSRSQQNSPYCDKWQAALWLPAIFSRSKTYRSWTSLLDVFHSATMYVCKNLYK